MTPWPPISRDDLRQAAVLPGFDTTFPVLIRRLIAETADGLTALDMPGEAGTAVGGYDGVATTASATTFVPAGTSVWELSVGGGETKANEDYSKRLVAPDGLATTDVTYVEALLVPWTKARTWQTEKKAEGRWKDVRGYNLDQIHTWLEQAPATTAWLAGVLGKALPGARSLTEWWDDTWLTSTRVPLDAAIVLAGRQKAADELVSMLDHGRKVITLGGDLRLDDAAAFVAAALEQATIPQAPTLRSRAVLVSDATSLAQLAAQRQPLVILLSDAALARDIPTGHAHQLIVAATAGAEPTVEVPRVDGEAVAEQLKTAGVDSHEAAGRLGTLARRSLLALRRALAHNPGLITPTWAATPDDIHRRLLLLGAWSATNDPDREIVAECVGQRYAHVEQEAARLSKVPDMPFLGQVGDIWHVVSVEDSWTLLSGALTMDDLTAFRDVVIQVFTETDPALDLAPDDRWKSGLFGPARRYSCTLRTGLAESLALLGASDSTISGAPGRLKSTFARLVVRDVLAKANADSSYHLWTSLTDIVSLLAEAAPNEFIEAMRSGLSGEQPAHRAMFTDNTEDTTGFGFGSNSPHSSFLWALETLAWSPEYIDDAVDVLAGLAAIDPGGRLSNRPLASLVGILSSWSPQTAAERTDRIRCIRRVGRHPVIGETVLLELIPDGHGIQASHSGPRFRGWRLPPAVTRADLGFVVEAATELLIDMLADDPDLYLKLIEHVDDVTPEHRSVIAARLKAVGRDWPDDSERSRLFEALRSKIAHHREFEDAYWALPTDQLDELQDACDALVSEFPRLRNAWLFRADWLTLGDFQRRDNFEAYEIEMGRRRAAAVGEILTSGGVAEVLDFAREIPEPHLVGTGLASNSPELDADLLPFLAEPEGSNVAVAYGYFGSRLRTDTGVLRDKLLGMTQNPRAQARILRLSDDPANAWTKLEGLRPETKQAYWQEFSPYGLGTDFAHGTEAGWALLDAGRPAAALELITLYSRKGNHGVEEAEVAAAGLEMLLTGEHPGAFQSLRRDHLERLFTLLSKHSEAIGHTRLVQLEWQLFPISGRQADAPTLHRALVNEPAFFVELVASCYRPDSDDGSGGDVDPERDRSIARRANEVLRSCRRCPGVSEEGLMDTEVLISWVSEARTLLAEADRVALGDMQIGELLAHSPAAAAGGPIHESVRDLLEDLRSDDIEKGLEIAIYNRRGATSRGVMEGGQMEWDLAGQFRENAEAAKNWPRTRRLLRRLSESYEADARHMDAGAERRQQGLGW